MKETNAFGALVLSSSQIFKRQRGVVKISLLSGSPQCYIISTIVLYLTES